MKYLAYIPYLVAIFLFVNGCNFREPIVVEPVNPNEQDIEQVIGRCMSLENQDIHIKIKDSFVNPPAKVSFLLQLSKANGSPMESVSPNDFSVFEKGRNDDCPRRISNLESNAQIAPKSQLFRYNTLLILDLSGSVIGGSLAELKDAALSFIDNVMPDSSNNSYRTGVWWFDGEDQLHQLTNFTSEKKVLRSAIASVDSEISNDPSTDLYGAIIKSSILAQDSLDAVARNGIISASSIVLFTDGTDQAARYGKQEALTQVSNSDASISYFTIGLGEEIDESILRTVGHNGSFFVDDKSELEETFLQTAELVRARANSYYLFEYCSPKRDGSGVNDLVIVVEQDTLEGFVYSKFDATGFSSGCN